MTRPPEQAGLPPAPRTLVDRGPSLGLLGVASPPGGGTIAVDLLDPDRTMALTLTRAAAARPEVSDLVAAARRAGTHGTTPPPLPDSWRRLCLVAGVDRWFNGELDEDLLAADLALAAVEAGDEGAARLFDVAHDALAALVYADARAPAVAAELKRVLRAAVAVRTGASRFGVLLEAFPSPGPVPTPDPGVVRWVSAAFDVLAGTASGGDLLGHLDPAHIAARLVLAAPTCVPGPGGLVEVSCPAFPHVTAATVGAGGLLARAAVAATGEIAGVGSLRLDADRHEFVGRLRLGADRPEADVVEVVDPRFPGRPRCRPEDATAVVHLATAQSAFREARQAAARSAVRDEADDTGFAAARMVLGEAFDADPAAWTAFDGTLDPARAGATVDEARRPLLAELAAAG